MPVKHTLHHIARKNGIEGYVISVEGAAVASYRLNFTGGYHFANSFGMPAQTSHVLEHILMGWVTDPAFPTRTAFVKELRKNGAYSNGHTNASFNWYDGSTTFNEWRRVLDFQRAALITPRLDEGALLAESGNAKEEMKRNVGDNPRLAYELALENLSKDIKTSAASIAEIKNVSLHDIKKYYDEIYTRQNLKFIIAGDFENQISDINEYFDGWNDLENGDKTYSNSAQLARISDFSYIQRESLETIYMQLSIGVNRRLTKKERLTLRLINNYLFSDTTSKVTYQAREKGWCYGIGTYIDADYGDTCVLSITAPISPDNIQSLFELLVREVKECAINGLSNSELEAVKSYATGRFIRYGQTMEEMVDIYSDFFAGDQVIHTDDQLVLLQSITSSDISSLLGEFLSTGIWTLAGVGGVEEKIYNEAYTVIRELFE